MPATRRTKAMFLASPGNPTGWMLTAEEQKTILDFCRARGIAILADEVYGTLIYDGAPHAPSFLAIADDDDAVFAINSFSKPWAMTGWRIGWLVHPKRVEGRRRRHGPVQQHRLDPFRPVWRAGGAVAGRRCVPRRIAGALPARAARWWRTGSAARTGCAG